MLTLFPLAVLQTVCWWLLVKRDDEDQVDDDFVAATIVAIPGSRRTVVFCPTQYISSEAMSNG